MSRVSDLDLGALEMKADASENYAEQLKHEVNQFISALQPSQPLEAMDTRADRSVEQNSVEQKGSDDAVPTGTDEDPDVVMSSGESDDTVVKAADADVPEDDVSEDDASDGDWGSDDSSDSDDDVADVLFQRRRAPAMQTHEVPKSAQKILTQCEKLLPLLMQSHTFKIPPAQINSVQNILQELQKKVDSFKTNQVPVEVKTAVEAVIVSCRGLSMGLKDREKAIGQHELYCIDVNSFKTILDSWRRVRVMAEASSSSSSSGKAEASVTISSGEYKQFVIDVCKAILKMTGHTPAENLANRLKQVYLLNKQANISELLECLQQDDFVFDVGDDNTEVKNLIFFVNDALKKLDEQLHQGNNESDGEVPRNKPKWEAFCSRVTAKVGGSRLIGCDRTNSDNLAEGWKSSLCDSIEDLINNEEKPGDVNVANKICNMIVNAIQSLNYSSNDITPETKRSLAVFVKNWVKERLSDELGHHVHIISEIEGCANDFIKRLDTSSEGDRPTGKQLELMLAIEAAARNDEQTGANSGLFGSVGASPPVAPTPQSSSDETSIVEEMVKRMKEFVSYCEREKASGTVAETYEQIFTSGLDEILNLYSGQLNQMNGFKLEAEISDARSIQGKLQKLLQGSTVSDLEAVAQNTMRVFMEGLDEISNPPVPMAFSTGSSSSNSSSNEYSTLTDLQVRDIIEQIQEIAEYAENGDAIQNIIEGVLNNLRHSDITPSEKVNRVSPLCEALTILSIFSTDATTAAGLIAGFVSKVQKEREVVDSSSSSSSSSGVDPRKRPKPDSKSNNDDDRGKRQRTSSFFSDPTNGCDPATSVSSNSVPAPGEPMDDTTDTNDEESTPSQPSP